jgi:hypothetical protein
MVEKINLKTNHNKPPKYWRYEGEIVEDVGNCFQKKDGSKIAIVTVWENGTPLYDYSQKKD